MLERNPEKRITLEELKQEQFFQGINWKQVEKKDLAPPIDAANFELNPRAHSDDEEEEAKENVMEDKDYTKDNKNVNRCPDITFTNSPDLS